MKTVANTIADELADAGVDIVFGLPGGETVELLDDLRMHGVSFVLARNESSAVFMADGYARVTGRPAVCMTTLGPGAANAAMGVAHCYLDKSPVIIITAQKPDSLLPDYTHQVIDLHALFGPISKASLRVHAGNAHHVVQDALSLATRGRHGPVHLQLSTEDAVALVDEKDAEPGQAIKQAPVQIATYQLERALQTLSWSKRSLIVAGLGLEPQQPYTALRSLAETIQAPVITTPKAKGALPDDHPLYAGTIGLTRTDPVYELVAEADCVLAIGFDVVELVKPWSFDGPLIWIAPWDNEDPKLKTECELVGELSSMLTAVANVSVDTATSWGEERVSFRQKPAPTVPPVRPGTISPQTLLRVMQSCAGRDAYLTVDVGSHKIFSSLEWQSFTPNRFLLSNGLSSMSYALPAAMGAAMASPGSQVLCLTGDAGLAMNMGELGAIRESNLPVVVIVLNDGAIDLIRSHQQRSGKPVFGTEFDSPNHAQIGAAFGLPSRRVDSEDDFTAVLADFLAAQTPSLIEVMLDPTGYPTTPRSD